MQRVFHRLPTTDTPDVDCKEGYTVLRSEPGSAMVHDVRWCEQQQQHVYRTRPRTKHATGLDESPDPTSKHVALVRPTDEDDAILKQSRVRSAVAETVLTVRKAPYSEALGAGLAKLLVFCASNDPVGIEDMVFLRQEIGGAAVLWRAMQVACLHSACDALDALLTLGGGGLASRVSRVGSKNDWDGWDPRMVGGFGHVAVVGKQLMQEWHRWQLSSPLEIALSGSWFSNWNGSTEKCVRLLLSHGLVHTVVDRSIGDVGILVGESAYEACIVHFLGSFEESVVSIPAGAQVRFRTDRCPSFDQPPLSHLACAETPEGSAQTEQDVCACASALLDRGHSANDYNCTRGRRDGTTTPLGFAAMGRNTRLVQLLLESGASPLAGQLSPLCMVSGASTTKFERDGRFCVDDHGWLCTPVPVDEWPARLRHLKLLLERTREFLDSGSSFEPRTLFEVELASQRGEHATLDLLRLVHVLTAPLRVAHNLPIEWAIKAGFVPGVKLLLETSFACNQRLDSLRKNDKTTRECRFNARRVLARKICAEAGALAAVRVRSIGTPPRPRWFPGQKDDTRDRVDRCVGISNAANDIEALDVQRDTRCPTMQVDFPLIVEGELSNGEPADEEAEEADEADEEAEERRKRTAEARRLFFSLAERDRKVVTYVAWALRSVGKAHKTLQLDTDCTNRVLWAALLG
jgi:hypothetical protein